MGREFNPKRPDNLSSSAKRLDELEYLVGKICEALKIKHRYNI